MFEPDRHPDHPVVVHWQSLVDRRLIGNPQPVDPANRARILAMEAIVCPRRRTGAIW
ncbi:MAG: hypothetical protein ACRYFW_06960 [Janthinobacterium lividum]